MNELVTINNGQPVTNSLLVAEIFGKRHADVMRDIANLSCSDDFRVRNFALMFNIRELPNGGSTRDNYHQMTKDGFSFLVMGYTGEKAGEFKERFINEFNKRDALLRSDDYILQRSQEILQNRVRSLEMQNELHKEQLQIQAPKVQYYNEVIDSTGFMTINKIALDFGMSAIKLNRILCENRIQYREGDSYLLYSKHRDCGYATLRPYPYIDSNGNHRTRQHLYWTEKGKQFIHDLIKKLNLKIS